MTPVCLFGSPVLSGDPDKQAKLHLLSSSRNIVRDSLARKNLIIPDSTATETVTMHAHTWRAYAIFSYTIDQKYRFNRSFYLSIGFTVI